jgi:hypothetical protein
MFVCKGDNSATKSLIMKTLFLGKKIIFAQIPQLWDTLFRK